MSAPHYLLHLSDLHCREAEECRVWHTQLAEDLRSMDCARLAGVIVSGDVTNLGQPQGYKAGREFFRRFLREFHVPRECLVVVPGNHDVDYVAGDAAYRGPALAPRRKQSPEGRSGHAEEPEPGLYRERLRTFSQFYHWLTGRTYSLDYRRQYSVQELPTLRTVVVGLNSAWAIDRRFPGKASIHHEAIAACLDQLRASRERYVGWMKLAVWHHPIHSEEEDRIRNTGFIEQLAKAGFQVALHGHIHRPTRDAFTSQFGSMRLIAAGTFGAPANQWKPGFPLEYNLLAIQEQHVRIHTRRREHLNGAWSPDARWGDPPKPYYDLELNDEPSRETRPHFASRVSWGEAPDIRLFVGRDVEHNETCRWIKAEECRLLAIQGMPGIGKTALGVKIAEAVASGFECVYWRDLKNAPLPSGLLVDLIRFIRPNATLPTLGDEESNLRALMPLLAETPVLLVLDNFETVLGEKDANRYRDHYEAYGQLLRRAATMKHKSCIILTSRVVPPECLALRDENAVRVRPLRGLEPNAIKRISEPEALTGTDDDWAALVRRYSGNPAILKLVSLRIEKMHQGKIRMFLNSAGTDTSDLWSVLDDEFSRLAGIEEALMYWMAVSREPVSLKQLERKSGVDAAAVERALTSLVNRYLATSDRASGGFTLENVIMEYVGARFVTGITREIRSKRPHLLREYSVVDARAKEYVRVSQQRLFVDSLWDQVCVPVGGLGPMRERLEGMLQRARDEKRGSRYLAGNVLNILGRLRGDLTGLNCSRLPVWSAFLRDIDACEIDLSFSDLRDPALIDTIGSVLTVGVQADGDLVAAGDSRGDLYVFDLATGDLQWKQRAHEGWVRGLAFSPNARLIATCGDGGDITIWNAARGTRVRTFLSAGKRTRALTFSPDGTMVAVGEDGGRIRTVSLTGKERGMSTRGHEGHVRGLCYTPDGRTLVSVGQDTAVRLWNCDGLKLRAELKAHSRYVIAAACDSRGERLATGGEDDFVAIWDLRTHRLLKKLRGHASWVWSLAFSPDGALLGSGSADRTARIWLTGTWECSSVFNGHTHWVRSVAFAKRSAVFVSGSDDQTLRVWDTSSGNCVQTVQGYANQVWSVSVSPVEDVVAVCGNDQVIRLYDLSTGECRASLAGHTGWIWSIAFSSDGQRLASAGGDGAARIWDLGTGRSVVALHHRNQVRTVAFNRTGSLLATAGDDGSIRLWWSSSGKCARVLVGHRGQVWAVGFSPDGQQLCSGGDDGIVHIWDVKMGHHLGQLAGHKGRILSVAFSSDQETVASGAEDCKVMLWNVRTRRRTHVMEGHRHWVQAVTFCGDGDVVASSSDDGTIRVWNRRTGRLIRLLKSGSNVWVRALAAPPDGRLLVSGSQDGIVTAWDPKGWRVLHHLHMPRPYERMNISGLKGLSETQMQTLKVLGAVEGVVGARRARVPQ